jgi:hypothetical protein
MISYRLEARLWKWEEVIRRWHRKEKQKKAFLKAEAPARACLPSIFMLFFVSSCELRSDGSLSSTHTSHPSTRAITHKAEGALCVFRNFSKLCRAFFACRPNNSVMASSSSSLKLSRRVSDIKEPKEYDVLLGRGAGAREHVGNQQFRAWIEPLKVVYAMAKSPDAKNHLARRVVDTVRSHKGRFLERDGATGVYVEVSTDRALLKTKQALREKPNPTIQEQGERVAVAGNTWVAGGYGVPGPFIPSAAQHGVFRRQDDTLPSLVASPSSGDPDGTSCSAIFPPQRPQTTPTVWNLVMNRWGFVPQPPPVPQYRAGVSGVFAVPGYSVASQFPMRTPSRMTPSNHYIPQDSRPTSVELMSRTERKVTIESEASLSYKSSESKEEASAILPVDSTAVVGEKEDNNDDDENDDSRQLSEEEIAAARFLFSELTTPERPSQDEKLTEEEKNDVIADLFGDLCTITQPRKRIKRSAITTTSKEVSILLLQMKTEIELISSKDKQAWLEASRKAKESEIDGQRQELFLRREDMDSARAAHRWVTYWEERRKFFGSDKFCLPMTLHGAMRDDHIAVESGFARILPGVDDSGRQMSLAIMRNHTRDGYSTESMVSS